jgi:adenosylmethionine-8-amino-7-oxononanoate aminotransferase
VDWIEYDKKHVWHPYSRAIDPPTPYLVEKAVGCKLTLANGVTLIDGMSSWWSVIHGYNRPELNAAIKDQLENFSHVMFGGLTHQPAIELAQNLINLTSEKLAHVFFSDSGSVAVEVGIKMALQYQIAMGKPKRKRLLTVRGGYHGDTLGAMSVCDPVTGMHSIFSNYLPKQLFVEKPNPVYDAPWDARSLEEIEELLSTQQEKVAAVILEPIVQGAGGMRFYHPRYLKEVKNLCESYDILLIADEIATGFGRTGKLFACEHAGIEPDVMCLGKALTGGYMTLAATLTTSKVAAAISSRDPKVFMHGPTFMANPLACSCAIESIRLLMSSDWQGQVASIENALKEDLFELKNHRKVKDVRVLGAIGVVQLVENIDIEKIIPQFIKKGVWIRPFKDLIYVMPPYVISKEELSALTYSIKDILLNGRPVF